MVNNRLDTRGSQSWSDATGKAQYADTCGKCGARRVDAQLGLEATPDAYIAAMVGVFREVRRVLRDDGTCWVNMGDSYAGGKQGRGDGGRPATMVPRGVGGAMIPSGYSAPQVDTGIPRAVPDGAKPKDLLLMPARLALALQADGWWVRSDIIWAKPNPMPESCTDRPTSAHEHVFLLGKSGSSTFWTHRDHAGSRAQPPPDYRWLDLSQPIANSAPVIPAGVDMRRPYTSQGAWQIDGRPDEHRHGGELRDAAGPAFAETDQEPPDWKDEKLPNGKNRWRRINLWRGHDYFYDTDAVREAHGEWSQRALESNWTRRTDNPCLDRNDSYGNGNRGANSSYASMVNPAGRNLRNVWTIATAPYAAAHFATMPTALVERCIKAGTSERGCCAACGAPWVRVTERGAPDLAHQLACGGDANGEYHGTSTKGHDAAGVQDASAVKARILAGMVSKSTSGWSPSCTCDLNADLEFPAAPIPCTVLDPFSGAGTALLVADRLGRDAVGIDLSHAYVEMTRERLTADCPLFMDIGPSPPPAADPEDARQSELFAIAAD